MYVFDGAYVCKRELIKVVWILFASRQFNKFTENRKEKKMTRSKWQKILYEDQGVSDNYVDETFLDELRKNRM